MRAPLPDLEPGEKLLAEFRPDTARYWRDHAIMALLGMGVIGVVLWAMESPHVAIGSLGAVLALAVRGLYLASETRALRWRLTDRRLILPGGQRAIGLLELETARVLLGDVQVISRSGDKHLMKHLADGPGAVAQILAARDKRAKRRA